MRTRPISVLIAVATVAALAVSPGARPARAADVDNVSVGFAQRASGLDAPVAIASSFDGTGRLFIVEQAGRIRVWTRAGGLRDAPFLSIPGRVQSGGEQGLLGLAFHPNYEDNGRFFVTYTDGQGDLRISRFRNDSPNDNNAEERTEKIILQVLHRSASNHNAGALSFRGGYLYVSTGDGGSGGDPDGNAQDLTVLKGKILRLDVNDACGDRSYCVPDGNPFKGDTPGRGEIWHFGLRNPWRFSFDQANGRMYIGDVGQNLYEEISVAPPRSSGLNFGWDCREGDHFFESNGYCDGADFRDPVREYNQTTNGRCAVIGGYVYRGNDSNALDGIYLYADHCSNEVWGLKRRTDGTWDHARVGTAPANLSSFGQRPDGEIFAVSLYDGRLWKVTGSA